MRLEFTIEILEAKIQRLFMARPTIRQSDQGILVERALVIIELPASQILPLNNSASLTLR
jgi:hypothetical protein